MKFKYYILLVASLSILFACDDDYVAPQTITDASWLISETNNVRINEGIYKVNQGAWISFVDLSKGMIEHEWRIGEGCHFMTTGFGKDEADYSKFVIEGAGRVTTDAKAHVYFGEPGIKNVQLYNTFPDSVAFTSTGETIGGVFMPGDTLAAIRRGEVWVIDTTFQVDVYGEVLPAISVYQLIEDDNGTVIEEKLVAQVEEGKFYTEEDKADFPFIKIGLGEKLRFVDETSYDRPDSTAWAINIADGVTIKSAQRDTAIGFNELGFITDMIGQVNVIRKDDETTGVPGAAAVTLIPLQLEVGPSSKPFRIDGDLKDQADELSLNFAVTGAVGEIKANAKDAFTVFVNNSDAGLVDYAIAVDAVTTNPDNDAEIILTLAERIYNTDDVVVSYSPGSEDQQIIRSDTKIMDAFDKQPVMGYLEGVNLFVVNNGFEVEAAKNKTQNAGAEGYWDGKNKSAGLAWTRTTEQAAEGEYSLKFSHELTEARTMGHASAFPNETPVGHFKVSLKLWIATGTTLSTLTTAATGPSATWNDLDDAGKYPRDTWVTVEQVVEATTSLKGNKLTYFIPFDAGYTGTQTFYIDDARWEFLEYRD